MPIGPQGPASNSYGLLVSQEAFVIAQSQQSKLLPYIRVQSIAGASTYRFNKLGTLQSFPHISGSTIPAQSVDHSIVTLTASAWDVPLLLDKVDLAQLPYPEEIYMARSIGYAIARRMDGLVINALNAGTTNVIPVDYEVPGTNTSLTRQKLSELVYQYRRIGQYGQIYLAVPSEAMRAFRNDLVLTNWQYNSARDLANPNPGLMRVDDVILIEMPEVRDQYKNFDPTQSLPVSGDIITCLAFVSDYVGYGDNGGVDMFRQDWDVRAGGWFLNGQLIAGSTVIDPEGIWKVLIDRTVIQ